jgi:YD repeat-containing protein
MSGITYADSTTDAWTYDANGALATETDGCGVTTTYTYDDAGSKTGIDYPTGTADVSFSYDADGRKTAMTDGTGTTSYSYDNAGRLTSRSAPQGTVNYAYDDAGRVSSRTLVGTGVTTYAYDSSGRVSSVTDSGDTIATPTTRGARC